MERQLKTIVLTVFRALMVGIALGQSQVPVQVAPGIYTFQDLARQLSTEGRRIVCEKAIRDRACVLALRSQSWDQVQTLLLNTLGVSFERTSNANPLNFRMVEPPALRLNRAKLRRQLLTRSVEYLQRQAATILDTVADANWSEEELNRRLSDLKARQAQAPSTVEAQRLALSESDLRLAVDYQSGENRFGMDLLVSCCPSVPEDLSSSPNGWALIPPASVPQPEGRPLPKKCLGGWEVKRASNMLLISPSWILLSPSYLVKCSAFDLAGFPLSTREQVQGFLKGAKGIISWEGTSIPISDPISQDAKTTMEVGQSSALPAKFDSVPQCLLSWSLATGSDVAEELNPWADALARHASLNVPDAVTASPQLSAGVEFGCLVIQDELEFIDEGVHLHLLPIIRARAKNGDSVGDRPILEAAMNAFASSSAGEQPTPWCWQGELPESYLGMPIREMAGGILAFNCWLSLNRPVASRIPLSELGPQKLAEILEVTRGSIGRYCGYLPDVVEILSQEELVVDQRDQVVTLRLERQGGKPPIVESSIHFVRGTGQTRAPN